VWLKERTPMTDRAQEARTNKAIYRRFLEEAFNRGNLRVLDEVLAPDYVFHDAPAGSPQGPEVIRRTVTRFRTGFPDLRITIEEMVAEGDKVAARATTRGTHLGEFFGIPATGKRVEMQGLTMVTVRDGRVRESWVKNDVAALFRQIGATAPAG